MNQIIIDSHKEYTDGSLDRRDFIKRIACITSAVSKKLV